MALSDLEWTQKLTDAVSKAAPKLYGEGAFLASTEPERLDRRYSFMFRYRIQLPNGNVRSVLVKIPRESWVRVMDEAITSKQIGPVTQREFDGMTAIADIVEMSNIPGLFAIRPGICFPELGALLMEEYSLRMLKTSLTNLPLIFGSKKAWLEFEKQVELAGMWLKVVQKMTGMQQTKPFAALDLQKQLDTEFAILEGVSERSWSVLRGQFQHLYDSLKGSDILLAAMHNDFHLGNIFVLHDGRIGVIDPNWVDNAPIYEDLSTLLIDPVTRKAQVLSMGLLFRPSQYLRYEKAIFRGYFGDSRPPLSLIYFYCALDVLFKWRTDEEILTEDDSWARNFLSKLIVPIFRIYFQRLITRYLKQGISVLDATNN